MVQAIQTYGRDKTRPNSTLSQKERDDLIVEYAPLVKYLANRLAMRVPPSVSVDDLISAGTLGLLDAVDRYDQSREVKFKTYAEFRIRGAMLDELRGMDWIPRSTRKKVHDIQQAITAVEARLGRPAEDGEVCQAMGISLDEYHKLLGRLRGIDLLSLDEYIRDDGSESDSRKSFKSLIQGDDDPRDNMMAEELRHVVADGIRNLTEKEQLVVSLYYYEELTLKEIGAVLGLTESRISQIHTKAIIKLRNKLKSYQQT